MSVAEHLETARLRLRKPQASNLAAYTAYCASDRSRFVGGPFTAAEAFDKFSSMIGHWMLRGFGRYVISLDGTPIGHVGPLSIDDSHPPEFTWTLWDGAFEGQGYATEAALRVRQHLLGDQGWPEMIIRILPDNTGSIRIAERLGATLTDDPAPDWYAGSVTYRVFAQVAA